MPSLDAKQLLDLLEKTGGACCGACNNRVRKNYCRQCDEYYYAGHAAECPRIAPGSDSGDAHVGHRTYDLVQLDVELQQAKLDFLDRRLGEISLGVRSANPVPPDTRPFVPIARFRAAVPDDLPKPESFDADGVDC